MSLSSGLIRGCSGAALGFKTEENKTFLRIYGFEGEPGGREGSGRGSNNQNVAGSNKARWSITRDRETTIACYSWIVLYRTNNDTERPTPRGAEWRAF